MRLPFRRKKTLPERILQAVAKFAGMARLLFKRHSLRARLPEAKSGKAA
jgi:hypothetical protein